MRKNTYAPDWDEVLLFQIPPPPADPGVAAVPMLTLSLLDWNATGKPEPVGQHVVSAEDLERALAAGPTDPPVQTTAVLVKPRGGSEVMGHTGDHARLTFSFLVVDGPARVPSVKNLLEKIGKGGLPEATLQSESPPVAGVRMLEVRCGGGCI